MMYSPTTFIIAAFTFLVNFVVATPPACLLAALQVQANPADITALCGSLQRQMEGNITEKCNGDSNAVMSIYSSTCMAKGVTISIPSSTSSTSKSGSATATTTSGASATGSGSGSGSAAGATAGSPASTGSSTATGSAASASATGKSAASTISIQSPIILGSLFMGCTFASLFFL